MRENYVAFALHIFYIWKVIKTKTQEVNFYHNMYSKISFYRKLETLQGKKNIKQIKMLT